MKTRNPQTILRITRKGRRYGDDGEKEGCVYIVPRECVVCMYMQTVNLVLYSGEGALRYSAIVNFARGEIPRPFLQKPRAIRPQPSARGTFRRKSRKEKGVIGPRARGESWSENARRRKSEGIQRKRERGLPIVPLTYFTLISPLYSIRRVAIAAKIASSCLDVERHGLILHMQVFTRSSDFKTAF